MLKLREQAEAILAQLKNIGALNQVVMIDGFEEAKPRRPVALPMAELVLASSDVGIDYRQTGAGTSWGVLVTARRMAGENGLVELVDLVLDNLNGFVPIQGSSPLSPVKVEFVDRGGVDEASSYALTFFATQRRFS